MGCGGPESSTVSNSVLYNWKKILPPWVQAGQQSVLPYLMNRAETGLLPQEERDLWGGIRGDIQTSGDQAAKAYARQVAASGMSPSSPMVAGGFSDLGADRLAATSKAALDFAKMKMGQKDTAIGQLLTALYTPPPVAVGTNTVQQSSGGGGK